ncbi:cysteine-rich motor neuron 1 protein [Drosophila eugracilis]|uniref:cysteine-rich motor neuron 1 protein n=1 Tax=Drosophila eugracilis TaxID=29029 RepID=UPI0007E8346F|nr:cysteine-rich motor neuron 1 protein [Drosophila eugracilis]
MPSLHKPSGCLHQMLIIYVLIFVSSATTLDQQEPLPDLCESIKCPPDAEMQCPADSSIRQNLLAVDLIKSNAVELPTTGDTSLADVSVSYDSSLISSEDYAQCCLNRKCVCKTCYIPDCDSDTDQELVVVELKPENYQKPGECCGTYECRTEPNCTVLRDTDYHWLTQCQRCRCESGLKICHKSCDDRAEGVCQSKISGVFYKDGETWTENCKTCECEKGEPKCTMSFCGNLNCPSERQVTLKDTCCPVCWPKCAPMPNEKQNDDDYNDYVDEPETPVEEDTLPPLLPDPLTTQQSAELIATSTTTSTTPATPLANNNVRNFDQPNVVEVVSQPNYISYGLTGYSVITTIIIVAMGIYICQQSAKKRSYDPVSILDHSI